MQYPITRLPLLSNKSRSMASVLEIYYPIWCPPLSLLTQPSNIFLGGFKIRLNPAWFCCFVSFFSATQSDFSMCCFNPYPSFVSSNAPPMFICLSFVFRCQEPHMNCKKRVLYDVVVLHHIKIGRGRRQKMLMTCWTTETLQFFLPGLGLGEWVKKVIKTLKQIFLLLRCSHAVDICWYTQFLPSSSLLLHNFFSLRQKKTRWRREFYHAPSTRINSLVGGLEGNEEIGCILRNIIRRAKHKHRKFSVFVLIGGWWKYKKIPLIWFYQLT